MKQRSKREKNEDECSALSEQVSVAIEEVLSKKPCMQCRSSRIKSIVSQPLIDPQLMSVIVRGTLDREIVKEFREEDCPVRNMLKKWAQLQVA